MGTDFYAYVLVGVSVKNYLQEIREEVLIQDKIYQGNIKIPAFDENGNPVMKKVTIEYYRYLPNGKFYAERFDDIEKMNSLSKIHIEGSIEEFFKSAGLDFEYDEYAIRGTVGEKLLSPDKKYLEIVGSYFEYDCKNVKEKLASVGITEAPKLVLQTIISW